MESQGGYLMGKQAQRSSFSYSESHSQLDLLRYLTF